MQCSLLTCVREAGGPPNPPSGLESSSPLLLVQEGGIGLGWDVWAGVHSAGWGRQVFSMPGGGC